MKTEIKINRSNNTIVLPAPYNFPYEVDLDRCRTPTELLGWIAHLAEKNWVTTEMIARLVAIVASEKGWKIHL